MSDNSTIEADAKKYSFGSYWFRLILWVGAFFGVNGLITHRNWLNRMIQGADPIMVYDVPDDLRNWPGCLVDSVMRADTHKAYLLVLLVFLILHLVFTNLFWGVLSSKPMRKMLHRQFMSLCVLGFFLEFISYTMRAWVFPPDTHFPNLMMDIPFFGWLSHVAVPLEELMWIVMVVPLFQYLYLYLNWWSHDIYYVFDTKDAMISKTMKRARRPKITKIYIEVHSSPGVVAEKRWIAAERISRFPDAQLHWLTRKWNALAERWHLPSISRAGSKIRRRFNNFLLGISEKPKWKRVVRNPGMLWGPLCGLGCQVWAWFLFYWGYTGEAIEVSWISAVLFFMLPLFLEYFPFRIVFFSIPLVSLPALAMHMGAVSQGQYIYRPSEFYLGGFTEGGVCAKTWLGLALSGQTMPMMAIFFFLLLPVVMFSLFTWYLVAYNSRFDDRKAPAAKSRSWGPVLRRWLFWALCAYAPLACLIQGILNGFDFTLAMAVPAAILCASAYRWSPHFRHFVGSHKFTGWLLLGGGFASVRIVLQICFGYGGYDLSRGLIYFPGILVMALAFLAMLCFMPDWIGLKRFKKLILKPTLAIKPREKTKRKATGEKSP